MKVGYGYNRSPRDFAPYECERLFLDDATTGRQERIDLMDCLDKPGERDTLVLLSKGDLGRGHEVAKLLADLEAANVILEIIQAPPAKPQGRPRKFAPSEDQAKRLEALWRSSLPLSHVLVRAREITGQDVKRHQMIYRFGSRWKKS